MSEPQVKVGILSAESIRFTLTGIYSTPGEHVVTGSHEVHISDSGLSLVWGETSYTSLEFTPTSLIGDSFEIEGVTIGVNFHWERQENQRFRGSLLLKPIDGKVTVINMVGIEYYLVSVISSEMNSTSSLPLLRAHAVISRSWVLAQMENRGKASKDNSRGLPISGMRKPSGFEPIIRFWDHEDHRDFDVCADDHCQRYQGISRVSTPVAASAVADTRGEVLTFDGELCDARFSKCCGGVFEKFENCWDDTPKPYLQAGRDGVDELEYPDLTIEENAREWILGSQRALCNTSDARILEQV
ncbi:MAG: SpoIID/LytB domain-containing protein, partial [Duncaniella sp.]|nr:SpoIID/LytB domain-containing protein [Duncaniella sp.]